MCFKGLERFDILELYEKYVQQQEQFALREVLERMDIRYLMKLSKHYQQQSKSIEEVVLPENLEDAVDQLIALDMPLEIMLHVVRLFEGDPYFLFVEGYEVDELKNSITNLAATGSFANFPVASVEDLQTIAHSPVTIRTKRDFKIVSDILF